MALRPADAVANDFFRARRFIGSGDRRAVSDRVWRILRTYRRLGWWLGDHATPRLMVAASLLLEGSSYATIAEAFSGGRFAPAPPAPSEQAILHRLEGRTLEHPSMPDAVRLEVPDWLLSHLDPTELRALLEPAPLDLRVNLLKATREEARAALAAEGLDATPTPHSPWGLRIEGRRQVTAGAAFRAGLVEIQDEGSQLVAARVDARPGMRVADLCAGAGGKTLALAMTMQNRGQLVACDVSATGWTARFAVCVVPAYTMSSAICWSPATSGSSAAPRPSTACWSMRPAPAPAPGGAIPMRDFGSPRPTLPNFHPSRRRFSIRPPCLFASAGV